MIIRLCLFEKKALVQLFTIFFQGYLKEMSKHGPAYFYQMYGNLPFPDPMSRSKGNL